MSTTVDLSGFNHDLKALLHSLQSTGQGGDMHQLVRTEAGQLANEIANQIGPKRQADQRAAILANVKMSLSFQPRKRITFTPGQQHSSYPAFTWLASGPNWLLGINDADDHFDANVDEAVKLHYAVMRRKSRGKTYIELGRRNAKAGKHQHLRRLNRYRVSRKVFQGVLSRVQKKTGQLRAAFAATAQELVPLKRVPSWVTSQIAAAKAARKQIFDPSGLNHPATPSITFGAAAAGVENNFVIREKVAGAVKLRSQLLAYKIKKIISGYAYRWETGAVFQPSLEDLS